MIDFIGVKLALIKDDQLLVIQRDDLPTIPFPNLWDFAGGGREENETPFECIQREVQEELGIRLEPDLILWEKLWSMHDETVHACFMVAKIDQRFIDAIVFGDEGQGWKMMTIDRFLSSNQVVEPLKDRLREYLVAVKAK